MPVYVGKQYINFWRNVLGDIISEQAHLVIDQPVGFALWGIEALPSRSLVLTFNRHPLYLLDLFERKPAGVLLAPDSIDVLIEALDLIARGHRVGSPPTLPFDAPTSRERQILRLAAQGYSIDDIAKKTKLQRTSIYIYLHNLRNKLNISNLNKLIISYLDIH